MHSMPDRHLALLCSPPPPPPLVDWSTQAPWPPPTVGACAVSITLNGEKEPLVLTNCTHTQLSSYYSVMHCTGHASFSDNPNPTLRCLASVEEPTDKCCLPSYGGNSSKSECPSVRPSVRSIGGAMPASSEKRCLVQSCILDACTTYLLLLMRPIVCPFAELPVCMFSRGRKRPPRFHRIQFHRSTTATVANG